MIAENTLAAEACRVRDQFASHFKRTDEFQELGAALAIYQRGEKIVDLHGGYMDAARRKPWSKRTLVNIWSASKGVMALAIAQLVDRNALSYDQTVATWWPEFAQNGKGAITLAQVMSHRAGLNGFAEPTTPEDLYDWDMITDRLARQAPLWPPGSAASYHGMTFGWLTGEIIRRVTGQTPKDYIRQQIAEPIGADLHLGLPRERLDDAAEIVPPLPDNTKVELSATARHTIENPIPNAAAANEAGWRAAQIPAVNIHATADGLARVYGALANGGVIDGVELISRKGLAAMTAPQGDPFDEMLGQRQWAAGFALNIGGLYGDSPHAFGHSGWGGSFGFADPETSRGVGYVINRMGSALNGDPRAKSLAAIAATIRSQVDRPD